jgi:hypothetical protein
MPTIVTRYVDTRSPAGGNGTTPSTGSGDVNRAYASLSESLAAESSSRGDLVARDEILRIECAGGLDTSSANPPFAPSFISDYDRYLWITANSASRHLGTWDGTKYTIASSGNNTSVMSINNTKVIRLEGLQLENRSTNGVWTILNLSDATTQDRELRIIDCHMRSISGSGNNGSGISLPYILRKSLIVVNTIIHGNFGVGLRNDYSSSGSRPTIIYNNTIVGAITGSYLEFTNSVVSQSIYNNIVQVVPNGIGYVTTSGIPLTTGNNISSDNTSPQVALRNLTIPFVNTASGNFNLTDRSSPAVNTGTNLSTDILYPFTTDIAGNIRGSGRGGRSWDIGALEYQRPANVVVRNIDNTSNILFSDDFNRADGTVGSNYQAASGSLIFELSSNTMRISSLAPGSTNHLNCVSTASALFPPDQETQITYTAINPTWFDFAGPAVRVNPANATGYTLRLDGLLSNGRGLCRIDSITSVTQIGRNLSNVAGDVWSIRAQGNVISVYRNGVLEDSVVDNTYSTGQPGMFYRFENSRATRMDNFIVRSVTNTSRISATGNRGRIIGSTTWG